MSEKLCLQWNDFKDNTNLAFTNLRQDQDFSDVTLACEDGQQLTAHKVILASSSPFFQRILRQNKHPHPLIFMRGVKSEDLSAIVDFLYSGEANVFQESLDSFLGLAGELQLKGMMGQLDSYLGTTLANDLESSPKQPEVGSTKTRTTRKTVDNRDRSRSKSQVVKSEADQSLAIQSWPGLEDLEERVAANMERSGGHIGQQVAYICKVCGKKAHKGNMRDHIEANHLEGIAIPCNHCGKIFKSRSGLRQHIKQH